MNDVEDALALYFKAYEQHRIDEILDWFLLPCHFVSDADEVKQMPLSTKEECRPGVQKVLDWHRSLGAERNRIAKQIIIELSPRISCVDVKVDVEDSVGVKLYDFEAVYTFVRSASTWRIAAITHNQIPRLSQRLNAIQ
jgi:hypothetical protein